MKIDQDIKSLQQALVKKGGNVVNIITGENINITNSDSNSSNDNSLVSILLPDGSKFFVRKYQLEVLWEILKSLDCPKMDRLEAMIYHVLSNKIEVDRAKAKFLGVSPRVVCYQMSKYRKGEISNGEKD